MRVNSDHQNMFTLYLQGNNATLGQFPFMALIGMQARNESWKEGRYGVFYSCVGTLINRHYVLTSASCIGGKRSGGVIR